MTTARWRKAIKIEDVNKMENYNLWDKKVDEKMKVEDRYTIRGKMTTR